MHLLSLYLLSFHPKEDVAIKGQDISDLYWPHI